jgi:NADH-quinone oxidoreductase subunit C
MTLDEVSQKLQARFPGAVLEKLDTKPDPSLKVDPKQIHDLLKYLRDELEFQTLHNLDGTDYPKQNAIAVTYHVHSYTHKVIVPLKAYLPREAPTIRSVTDLWKGANWMERETWDLLGVTFEGHPDPRRVLLPEDWQGHPLRKDYKVPDFYNGMPVPLYFDDPAASDASGGE